MYFNVLTGERVEQNELTCSHLNCKGVWFTELHATHPLARDWYPCFDWCGRYTGSLVGGVFQDAENINEKYGR